MAIKLMTGLFVLSILLGIVELWFVPWSPELFIKIEMTIAALFVVVLVIWFGNRESREDRANRSGMHLDD
jgi:hypothetical protein